MTIQAVTIFSNFITRLTNELDYKQILLRYETQYNLKKFKITEIPAESAFTTFQHIVQKFYKNHNPGQSGTWVENQLRLYLWTVICYMELFRIPLANLEKRDWDFFASIFYVKEYNLFQYQARILLDEQIKISKWTQQQDYMLYCIIIKDKSAKWNQIAKSLFINSNKKYLRASKQCRERWLNHLDPTKTKSQWNLRQYLLLFEQVQQKGKKWAFIVKVLKDKRSQHSIKNKYNSIIKKQQRITSQLNQSQVRQQLIKRIISILQSHHIDSTDEYLFGCSLKLLNTQQKSRETEISEKKNIKVTPEQIQECRNRFDNFRKKIQKFQCNIQAPKIKLQPKTTRKPTYMKQFNFTMPVLKAKPAEPVQQQIEPVDDQIFYQDSFQVDQLRPHTFHNLFVDDLKNMMNEHELDL